MHEGHDLKHPLVFKKGLKDLKHLLKLCDYIPYVRIRHYVAFLNTHWRKIHKIHMIPRTLVRQLDLHSVIGSLNGFLDGSNTNIFHHTYR